MKVPRFCSLKTCVDPAEDMIPGLNDHSVDRCKGLGGLVATIFAY